MQVFHLPNGRIVNPAHVRRVAVRPHFWDRARYYVQLELQSGDTEDVSERLPLETANELQEKYAALIRDAFEDVSAYQQGFEDGRMQGHEAGYAVGYGTGESKGYNEGFQRASVAAYEQAQERLLLELSERRARLHQEHRDRMAKTPDRRRYLRHATALLDDLIESLSSRRADKQ